MKITTRKIIAQKRGFANLLGPLMRTDLPLMKNVLAALAKAFFVPLGLTAATSVADVVKKTFGSGMAAIIISNDDMKDIMKIVASLEEWGLLVKGASEAIRNDQKEQ